MQPPPSLQIGLVGSKSRKLFLQASEHNILQTLKPKGIVGTRTRTSRTTWQNASNPETKTLQATEAGGVLKFSQSASASVNK
jgi:hypothetical protein